MRAFDILATLAVFVPFATADCVTRTSGCSPIDVCNRMSGAQVCGTTETASGCQTSVIPQSDSGSTTQSQAFDDTRRISFRPTPLLANSKKAFGIQQIRIARG
ncbi:hypothetical protein FDECE_13270 [Fusarium decemcellulare]|nr:hypothetical protein FDECE_13270 [Fusarium decemcellulare]